MRTPIDSILHKHDNSASCYEIIIGLAPLSVCVALLSFPVENIMAVSFVPLIVLSGSPVYNFIKMKTGGDLHER